MDNDLDRVGAIQKNARRRLSVSIATPTKVDINIIAWRSKYMKYRILVDRGKTGYNEYGGLLKICRLIRKELDKGTVIEIHRGKK